MSQFNVLAVRSTKKNPTFLKFVIMEEIVLKVQEFFFFYQVFNVLFNAVKFDTFGISLKRSLGVLQFLALWHWLYFSAQYDVSLTNK